MRFANGFVLAPCPLLGEKLLSCSPLPSVLLFITGVLTGVIVGFILSKMFGRSRPSGNGGDLGVLEERLGQANE